MAQVFVVGPAELDRKRDAERLRHEPQAFACGGGFRENAVCRGGGDAKLVVID